MTTAPRFSGAAVWLEEGVVMSVWRCWIFFGIAIVGGIQAHADEAAIAAAFGMQLPTVHKLAPDFSLPALDGSRVSLHEFRGHVVVLHFWATWCPPCRHEMQQLQMLEQNMAGTSLRIVCVNVDHGDGTVVRSFMREAAPGFHTLLDVNGEVRNRYAVRAFPTAYIIDRDGRIVGRIIGERDWTGKKARALLYMLLKKEPYHAG